MLDPRQQRSERASEPILIWPQSVATHGGALHTGNTFQETVITC
jgi:hypothetical protein